MSGTLTSSPPVPRTLWQNRWPGIEFRVRDEDISQGTTWRISSERHVVVVHLRGVISRLETEMEGAGPTLHPPLPGEVWAIPAQTRYASAARGGVIGYAEILLDAPGAEMRPRAGHYDAFLYQCAVRLVELAKGCDDLAALSAASISQTMRLHICREYAAGGASSERGGALSREQRKQVREFIEERLPLPVRLSHLTAIAGMTAHELLIAFRRSFGVTPAQYVLDQRVGRARWLLRSTRRDITSIALEAGFSSHAHLSTTFRKRVGVTPAQFRAASR